MDKEKDEIIINETESVVEPARPEPATEPKPKKRVCLGILLSVLGILLVGGALALGYLWGTNAPHATDSNTQSSSSKTDSENTAESESKEEQTGEKETAAEDASSTKGQNSTAEALDRDYFYISDWGIKIKTPRSAVFSYATDGQYRVFVWGHKNIQGEQAVPAHGSIGFWDDVIVNPAYLGMIQVKHCDWEDCSNVVFRSKDGSIGLVYQESTTAAEKYASSEKHNPSSDPSYTTMVTTDVEMLKEHFTNPDNYIEL